MGAVLRQTVAALVVLWVLALPAAAAEGVPVEPVNLQVVGVTEDSVTVVWGPSQPGQFQVLSQDRNGSGVTVGWTASEDPRGPVVYDVRRDNLLVTAGISQTQWRFTGIRKVSSFRVCVTAHSGEFVSAPGCGTISRQ